MKRNSILSNVISLFWDINYCPINFILSSDGHFSWSSHPSYIFWGTDAGRGRIGSRCKWKPHRIHGTQKYWNYKKHMLVDSEKWKLWVGTHKSFNLFKMSWSVPLLGAPSELPRWELPGWLHLSPLWWPYTPKLSQLFSQVPHLERLHWRGECAIGEGEKSKMGMGILLCWSTYMVTEAVQAAHIHTHKISHLLIHGCLFVSPAFSWHSWEQKQLRNFWHVTYMIFLFH